MNKPYLNFIYLTLAGIALVLSANTKASQQHLTEIPYQDITSGTLFIKHSDGYQVSLAQNSDYNIEIKGMLARTTLTQTFHNQSDDWVEAVYIYPLANGVAVDSMLMKIGDRVVVGKIEEKQKAKKVYQQAKRKGKKASLVSQQRPNLFTTKVANIGPKQSISVEISFQQLVHYQQGEFSLRIPLTITPRFIPRTDPAQKLGRELLFVQSGLEIDDFQQTLTERQHDRSTDIQLSQARHRYRQSVTDNEHLNPVQADSAPWQQANINVVLHHQTPLAMVASRYHKIEKNYGQMRSDIRLSERNIAMDRDFELNWRLPVSEQPQMLWFTEADKNYQYALLMLVPPSQQPKSNIAQEMIYIIDVSGSMGGSSIKQAKKALSYAINQLNHNDKFNVIAFSSDSHAMSEYSLDATNHNKAYALDWVNALNAGGGTNMGPALEKALGIESQKPWLRQVVFITDGAVSNEAELMNYIEQQLLDSRLHTIGIGSAPNSYFMEGAAQAGRGSYRNISTLNEVAEQMSNFFRQINRPVFVNLAADWPIEHVEMYPKKLPDLYHTQPLMISARWPRQLGAEKATEQGFKKDSKQDKAKELVQQQSLIVHGDIADRKWQQQVVLPNAIREQQSGDDLVNADKRSISTWWAKQQLNELLMQKRRQSRDRNIEQEQQDSLSSQILSLALEYQLLSPVTSFVAVEQKVSRKPERDGRLHSKKLVTAKPKGSLSAKQQAQRANIQAQQLALNSVPATATLAPYYQFQALIWAIVGAIGWLFYWLRRKQLIRIKS